MKSSALSVKGLMILVLKCKWGSLECFKICEERLWNCHYGVITVASHRSGYKDGSGVGVWTEALSARGLPAELSWSGRVWRDHPEDWGFWREQFRKSMGIHSRRSGWRDRWLEQRSMATGQVGKGWEWKDRDSRGQEETKLDPPETRLNLRRLYSLRSRKGLKTINWTGK